MMEWFVELNYAPNQTWNYVLVELNNLAHVIYLIISLAKSNLDGESNII